MHSKYVLGAFTADLEGRGTGSPASPAGNLSGKDKCSYLDQNKTKLKKKQPVDLQEQQGQSLR